MSWVQLSTVDRRWSRAWSRWTAPGGSPRRRAPGSAARRSLQLTDMRLHLAQLGCNGGQLRVRPAQQPDETDESDPQD